jgi:hypothetical protein
MNIREDLNRIMAVILVATLIFAPSMSTAQQASKSSAKWQSTAAHKASQNANAESVSPRGPQEGIKVHGHWSIVIKNPDGAWRHGTNLRTRLCRALPRLGMRSGGPRSSEDGMSFW